MLWFPDAIRHIQTVCALRFDGYGYEQRVLG